MRVLKIGEMAKFLGRVVRVARRRRGIAGTGNRIEQRGKGQKGDRPRLIKEPFQLSCRDREEH